MASASRRGFEWDGRDLDDAGRELRALPPGRYALVPIHELGAVEGELDALGPRDLAAIDVGLEQIDRADVVRWRDVRAAMASLIADARAGSE